MSIKQGNYKVVLLGDTSVGKSCLASRFVNNSFLEFQEPTIGAAFMTKTLNTDTCKIRFEILFKTISSSFAAENTVGSNSFICTAQDSEYRFR